MSRRWIGMSVFSLDVMWLVLALGFSYAIRYGEVRLGPPSFYWLLIVAGVSVWTMLFRAMRLDSFEGGWRVPTMIGRTAFATGLLMAFVLTTAYLEERYYSRLLLSYFGLLLLVGFIIIRIIVYYVLRGQHRRGVTKKVVLVGNDRVAREFAFKIQQHPELLYELVGTLYLAGEDAPNQSFEQQPPHALSSIDVLDTLNQYRIDELIVLEQRPDLEFQAFVSRCHAEGIHVSVLPRGYELYTSRLKLIEIDGLPLISLENPTRFPLATAVKRATDVVITLFLLMPAAILVCIAALVLVIDKRRPFRKEIRAGKNGRLFAMYRLNIDRESDGGPGYEHLFRDLSVSELPQLLNVFRGEMSLVGPRPESPDRVKHYSEWQRERLKATPGMTGLAQVNGLREQHPSEEKTRFDLQYILEWTPLEDWTLLLRTVGTLAARCFRPGRRTMVIPQPVTVCHDPVPFIGTDSVRGVAAHADRA
jgi:lipopolysaccharide/colanic/teichoic acid biosynthesis glycosyltransferase